MMKAKQGFTLIELMIVVAIIGILAAIAIPKFADLINKSKEGATKGSLSSVRSAIQVYYGDNEGWFPADNLTVLTASAKYINAIPVAKLPGTGLADNAAVATFSSSTVAGVFQGGTGTPNVGGWAYFNDATASSQWGTFVVNSTAQDIKGDGVWSSF
jgi:general secretion pathway protein G